MRRSYVAPLVITLLILSGICGYFLFDRMTTVELPNEIKKTTQQTSSTVTPYADTRQELNNITDILGQAAYSSDGAILGILYDVFANAETGEIEWVSINVEGNTGAPLVKLKSSFVDTFGGEFPIVLSLSKAAFTEYPVQSEYDKDLLGFVSLRGIPDAQIVDFEGKDIGDVIKIDVEGTNITNVYFTVSAPIFEYDNNQEFVIPFEYLKFANVDDFYIEGVDIALTERQTGALKAYAKIYEQ